MMKPSPLLALLAATACAPVDPDPPAPDANPGTDRATVLTFPATLRALDLLFVIDDSPSMADKQAALAAAFPRLVEQLSALEGGIPDLHLGVISSDMGVHASASQVAGPIIGQVGAGGCAMFGKNGALLTRPNVLANATDTYIKQPRGGAANYVGSLAQAFATQAQLGAGGCGFEQPLAAMAAAFSNPANDGFIRAEASLAVIILSDEDDCSVHDPNLFAPESPTLGPLQSFRCFRFGVECAPDSVNEPGVKSACRPRQGSLLADVTPFRDALLAVKGYDARKVMLGAIVGPADRVAVTVQTPPGAGTAQNALEHACSFPTTTGEAVADPAVRIAALVNSFPGRHALASVCSNDLATPAIEMGKGLKRIVGDRCLEKPLPGTDCILVDERADAEPTTIARCDAANGGSCWSLVDDPSCEHGQRVDVIRQTPAAADTFTSLRCR